MKPSDEIKPHIVVVRLDRREIAFVQHILEGYEGMLNATTIDAANGLVELDIMPDFVEESTRVLGGIRADVSFEICSGLAPK